MAPSAAAKLNEDEINTAATPDTSKSSQKGIRGILLGPPGAGKGTQVPLDPLFKYFSPSNRGIVTEKSINPIILLHI